VRYLILRMDVVSFSWRRRVPLVPVSAGRRVRWSVR
jgi:hypothetical protein